MNMHINVGDKLVATKNVSVFFNEGDIVEVINVSENKVSFTCYNADAENHIRIARSGQMDIDTCNQYFTKLEEEEKGKEQEIFERINPILVSVHNIINIIINGTTY